MGTNRLTCVTKITDSLSLTCVHRLRDGGAPMFAVGRLSLFASAAQNLGYNVGSSRGLVSGANDDARDPGCSATSMSIVLDCTISLWGPVEA